MDTPDPFYAGRRIRFTRELLDDNPTYAEEQLVKEFRRIAKEGHDVVVKIMPVTDES